MRRVEAEVHEWIPVGANGFCLVTRWISSHGIAVEGIWNVLGFRDLHVG